MPRPLRIEYPGAIYHVMSRGDRKEAIFVDDDDRRFFLYALGQACEKTGWQIHAYVLMGNHFHLVVETPQANLSLGMKWLLGTYTMRHNRRHEQWGHLFGGRYKAQLVDERDAHYLVTACDYVHLNPARARLLKDSQTLANYPWSSFPAYLKLSPRKTWLRVDRVFDEHRVQDTPAGRREFAQWLEFRSREGLDPNAVRQLRRGWRFGSEDFLARLAEKAKGRRPETTASSERRETDVATAENIVQQGLAKKKWTDDNLQSARKSDPLKVAIARELRQKTPVSRKWIAQRLHMGSASYVSQLLARKADIGVRRKK